LPLDNRRFTYRELEEITNNFHRVLGRGGFGVVYSGFLEDGSQVAVKLRSQTSSQGVTEFLAEVMSSKASITDHLDLQLINLGAYVIWSSFRSG
jgi:predicted Ser/Thr protein kinase